MIVKNSLLGKGYFSSRHVVFVPNQLTDSSLGGNMYDFRSGNGLGTGFEAYRAFMDFRVLTPNDLDRIPKGSKLAKKLKRSNYDSLGTSGSGTEMTLDSGRSTSRIHG